MIDYIQGVRPPGALPFAMLFAGWPAWPLSSLETAWCALALALGYGVVAAPLLTFVMPLSTVAPVITLLGLLVSLRQAVKDWFLIDWRRLAIFIPGSIVGVGLGVLAFKAVDPAALAR